MAMLKLSENRKRNKQAEQILADPDGYFRRARQQAEAVVDAKPSPERTGSRLVTKLAR